MTALVHQQEETDAEGNLTGEVQVRWWCPGCRCLHRIRITPSPTQPAGSVWQYNGNEQSPTFSPSVLTTCPGHPRRAVCHIFVKAGEIQFLNDCTHELAGKIVPMKPWAEVINPHAFED
jgi:hypothetical protein